MIGILLKEFGVWGESETFPAEGAQKAPRRKLFGKIHIKVLFVVFDWTTFIYGTRPDNDEQNTIDQAVAAGNINRVSQLNSMRSFELSIRCTAQVSPPA
jgi:hypothetical protein